MQSQNIFVLALFQEKCLPPVNLNCSHQSPRPCKVQIVPKILTSTRVIYEVQIIIIMMNFMILSMNISCSQILQHKMLDDRFSEVKGVLYI